MAVAFALIAAVAALSPAWNAVTISVNESNAAGSVFETMLAMFVFAVAMSAVLVAMSAVLVATSATAASISP